MCLKFQLTSTSTRPTVAMAMCCASARILGRARRPRCTPLRVRWPLRQAGASRRVLRGPRKVACGPLWGPPQALGRSGWTARGRVHRGRSHPEVGPSVPRTPRPRSHRGQMCPCRSALHGRILSEISVSMHMLSRPRPRSALASPAPRHATHPRPFTLHAAAGCSRGLDRMGDAPQR